MIRHQTISPFEVATAENVQEYIQDQVLVRVDEYAELEELPGEVKAAYVLYEGQAYIRDNEDAWKRMGGMAEVSETEPTNPALGQLWVKPSERFPLPYRGLFNSGSGGTVTATDWGTQAPSTAQRSYTNGTGKSIMVNVSYSARMRLASSATANLYARLFWTGALTGDSLAHHSWATGLAIGCTSAAQFAQGLVSTSFTMVLPDGTTTFGIEAYRTGSPTTCEMLHPGIDITPIAWADMYQDGVS